MLMKLTTALNIDAWISFALPDVVQHEWAWRFEPAGVNFINVKHANFLYERYFDSFFSSNMYIVKAAETTFVQKICTFNVDEIDTCPRLAKFFCLTASLMRSTSY